MLMDMRTAKYKYMNKVLVHVHVYSFWGLWVRFMLFNAIFNNISVISWWSVLLLEETGVPGENHRLVASYWQLYHIMLYRVHLAWVGFELTTLVVKGTDCIDSCKSNYHPITTTTAPPNHKDNHTRCNIIWTMRWKTIIKDHN